MTEVTFKSAKKSFPDTQGFGQNYVIVKNMYII